MKSRTIIIVLILCFIFIGIFIWGYSNSDKSKSSDQNPTASVQGITKSQNSINSLTTSETSYDFGMISMKNGDVTKEFIVNNPTNKDITVNTVITSCMCTTAFITDMDGNVIKGPFGMPGHGGLVSPANEIIKAGESRKIRVVYDPNAHGPAGIGQINRFIELTDSNGAKLQLEIKANVTP
ncbi:MAG: DUF1573 domain-containing protein [Patescibacteria group bacterium]